MRAIAARWFVPGIELLPSSAGGRRCRKRMRVAQPKTSSPAPALRERRIHSYAIPLPSGKHLRSMRTLPTALALACTLAPAYAQDSESEPFLQAPALVQPALLSGPNFHVV